MIKLSLDDFIYEVKEEICCYEDIGREGAEKWETGFKEWLVKHSDLKIVPLDDESTIFEIADEYIEAAEQNNIASYWRNFSL